MEGVFIYKILCGRTRSHICTLSSLWSTHAIHKVVYDKIVMYNFSEKKFPSLSVDDSWPYHSSSITYQNTKGFFSRFRPDNWLHYYQPGNMTWSRSPWRGRINAHFLLHCWWASWTARSAAGRCSWRTPSMRRLWTLRRAAPRIAWDRRRPSWPRRRLQMPQRSSVLRRPACVDLLGTMNSRFTFTWDGDEQ